MYIYLQHESDIDDCKCIEFHWKSNEFNVLDYTYTHIFEPIIIIIIMQKLLLLALPQQKSVK